ncbi:glycine cleavage system aminomethyltransferase GcvT [candidate division KSB1 bacterium]|nr:glycine cleavage system aminomethyltransferase GcvT [candidate division KSB1 bacterium]
MGIKKTALYDIHEQAGAKLIEFAGYYMPIQYKGILDEHLRVRKTAGLFDVSHMGEFEISGENAEQFLQYVTINDVSKLNEYQAQYSAMCYKDGGIVDDLLIYRYPDRFLMVVNAANIEKDFQWLKQHLSDGVQLIDRSEEFSLMALQGRHAPAIVQKLTSANVSEIGSYWFRDAEVADKPVMLARTGYTGEDGFEIMTAPENAPQIWKSLMKAGSEFDLEPIGLGARDTLRLEVTYCLYGNDIDHTTNPLEAGLGWITKLKKGEFIGSDAIQKVKQDGISRKLIGFEMKSKAFPRKGYEIYKDEREVGHVTSGMYSPILEKAIGLGYVAKEHSKVGTELEISIRGRKVSAEIIKTPFYKRPY